MQKIRKIPRADFEKSSKKPIFGQIWAKICRMRFFSKIGLRYFLGFIITYLHAKNQKKLTI